jgi:AcrR family transcriptional regulator
MADPLIDTLFRSTALPARPPAIASAAPVRETGTRSRAGNAMNRTRAALLDGARRAVEASGTKITMAQVAAAAGVAKATLYNHFRTREAVLDAVLLDEVEQLVDRASGLPLGDALDATARAISDNPLLRTLARIEPATVAALGRIDRTAPGWQRARGAVDAAVAAEGRGGGEFVQRWLASFLLSPGRSAAISADVSLIVAALAEAPAKAGVAASA